MIKPKPNFIMYLRIGKAGSSTLRSWFNVAKNREVKISSGASLESIMTIEEEETLVKSIITHGIGGTQYQKYQLHGGQHTLWPNFTRHSLSQPSMFTMMRKPSTRYVSQYEFWRTLQTAFGKSLAKDGLPLEQCAEDQHQQKIPVGCPIPNYQTLYLCGHGPPCVVPPDYDSFLQAEKHLRQLDVIGVIENLIGMEALLFSRYPHFFRKQFKISELNRTRRRGGGPIPRNYNASVWEKIEENHKYDNRLYEIALERMKELIEECELDLEELKKESEKESSSTNHFQNHITNFVHNPPSTTYDLIEKEPIKTDCMVTPQPNFVMFLCIGKAGSTTLRNWFSVAKYGDVRVTSGPPQETVLTIQEEEKVVKDIIEKGKLQTYKYHLHAAQHTLLPNFTRHSFPQPSMIAMLRDPASRYISQFQFWRTLNSAFGKSIQERGPSLETCLLEENQRKIPYGCPVPNYQTLYLCGHGPPCVQPPDFNSFKQAEKHLWSLDVVGVLENISQFEKLISFRYPHFFKNVAQTLQLNKTRKKDVAISRNFSSEIWGKLKQNHHYDYKLYRIALERMNSLIEGCNFTKGEDTIQNLNWMTIKG